MSLFTMPFTEPPDTFLPPVFHDFSGFSGIVPYKARKGGCETGCFVNCSFHFLIVRFTLRPRSLPVKLLSLIYLLTMLP